MVVLYLKEKDCRAFCCDILLSLLLIFSSCCQVLKLEPWNKEAKKEFEKLNQLLASEKKDQAPDKGNTEAGKVDSTKDTKSQKVPQVEKLTPAAESKNRKESSDVKDAQDAGNGSSNQGSKTRAKKLKIEEVGFVNEEKSPVDPDVVIPIEKPPHLRSMVRQCPLKFC